MIIKICKTSEWDNKLWVNYCDNFNSVFKKQLKVSDFKRKYKITIDGLSYHALLYNDRFEVIGSCTVIPFAYKKNKKLIKIGLVVDVFILESYRTDPLILRRMYTELKKFLISNNFVSVIAVPNEISYAYWKSVVKWKDVGNLSYWVLPIRLGNILKKVKILNLISLLFVKILILINKILLLVVNRIEKKSLYELNLDKTFIKHRYSKKYNKIISGDVTFYYRIYNENGVQTAYLIDARQGNKLSFKALIRSANYIIQNTNADLILYIGSMNLFQTLFLKSPKKFEPKRLPLTCDILEEKNLNKYSDMFDIKNWNFGLLNYDVR